ncbi:MAG: hybrid sensor histidine kinase/response regulator [Halobacteriales archaeon]
MINEPSEELNLLLVEDNPGDARLFKHHLNTERTDAFPSPEVTHVETLEAGFERLASKEFDLVLLDLGLPESSGLDTLERYTETIDENERIDPVPVIVLTGLKDDETSLVAVEHGAQDYIVKDNLNINVLNRAVRHAIERYRQEQTLREQNRRLEKFASVVSHDLRSPLSVAGGRATLAQKQCAAGKSAEEHFEILQESLDRMDELIDDLLTMTRTGQIIETVESVSLSGAVAKSWEEASTGEATLDLQIPEDTTVEADPNHLRRVLMNLIRNSVEHNDPPLTVRVGVAEGTEGPESAESPAGFFLEDDGTGIPDDERDDVFDYGHTLSGDGTGYGLSIVADIVDAHGWDISLSDSAAGGARFEIRTDGDLS